MIDPTHLTPRSWPTRRAQWQSFFGHTDSLSRLYPPVVAAPIDELASTVAQRADTGDYFDIHAMNNALSMAGVAATAFGTRPDVWHAFRNGEASPATSGELLVPPRCSPGPRPSRIDAVFHLHSAIFSEQTRMLPSDVLTRRCCVRRWISSSSPVSSTTPSRASSSSFPSSGLSWCPCAVCSAWRLSGGASAPTTCFSSTARWQPR